MSINWKGTTVQKKVKDAGRGVLWKPSWSGKPRRTWTWTVASLKQFMPYSLSLSPTLANHKPTHNCAPLLITYAPTLNRAKPLVTACYTYNLSHTAVSLVSCSWQRPTWPKHPAIGFANGCGVHHLLQLATSSQILSDAYYEIILRNDATHGKCYRLTLEHSSVCPVCTTSSHKACITLTILHCRHCLCLYITSIFPYDLFAASCGG